MGDLQPLPNGDVFIGWGPTGHFSEFTRQGKMLYDAQFVESEGSYRAFRFPWTGQPPGRPSVAISATSSGVDVYASWNGATQVTSWRVLGGSTEQALRTLRVFPKTNFETEMAVAKEPFVAVEALNSKGKVLGRSQPVKVG